MNNPLKCPVCEQQTLELRARAGRFTHHKQLELEIPADFALPECSNCGARPVSLKTAKALTEVLEGVYTRRLSALADQSLDRLAEVRPLYEWERLLGYSKGWLSKIREARTPAPQLVALLHLLANAPERLRELQDLWSTTPHRVVAGHATATAHSQTPRLPRPLKLVLVSSQHSQQVAA
jgi:hypothetical protein